MPLDALSAANGGLDEFRITSPSEIAFMLRKLQDGSVLVNLNSPTGALLTTAIWAIDAERGVMSFNADAGDPRVRILVEDGEAVVVAYLESIKLQFNVSQLAESQSAAGTALTARLPREMFRFQRRSSFRVRPLLRSSPTARFRHPGFPDIRLSLRVLDVSLGGCAVLLLEDVPAIARGTVLSNVQIDLDADARFTASLRVQHVETVTTDPRGLRLGCELINPSRDAERGLQSYIDQTQRLRRLLALE